VTGNGQTNIAALAAMARKIFDALAVSPQRIIVHAAASYYRTRPQQYSMILFVVLRWKKTFIS
jgi:hypothetical protein